MYYEKRNGLIYFGNYYYDDYKTKAPIAWEILTEKDGYALIVTRYIIDAKEFFSGSNDYEKSTIRSWLNNTFFNTAFNTMEKTIIKLSKVDNSLESTGQRSCDYLCKDTYDKIFLLSYKEVMEYTYREIRMVRCTPYAKSRWLHTMSSIGQWWLRSPCNFYYPTKACAVAYDGSVYGEFVSNNNLGVRPACWIKL